MTVCLFGMYDPNYSRNRVLISGFKKNNWQVIECRVNPKEIRGIKKYFFLARKFIKLMKTTRMDLLWVAFPGQTVVWLAYLLFPGRIVFDAFLSLYNSEVEDRLSVPKISLRAGYYWGLDWLSCFLIKDVILDTNEHINYFVKEFKLSKTKFHRLFVSTTPEVFYPIVKELSNDFIVHFHGSNIPLQGLPIIMAAAKLLENKGVKFNIIAPKVEESLPSSVSLIEPVGLDELNQYLSQADVVLGIFGSSFKATMVIPNKVYEALAVQKPVITSQSPAILELLTDGENALLCTPNDPMALAQAIMSLKADSVLRDRLAKNGYKLFINKLLPQALVEDLIQELKF